MSFPRYPKYKPSGVEWLGDVPEGWAILPGKRSLQRRKELNRGMKCENRLSLTMAGVIPRELDDVNGLQASEYETYQIFQTDDLAFKLIDLENIKTSRVGLVPEIGIMSPAYIRIEPNKRRLVPNFAYWFYTHLYVRNVFNGLGGGVRQTLTAEELLLLQIPSPPLPEQTAIAEFLDRETAKIDGLVAEQQRLMELLKEKRQAVISHAVTKGLNPHAPMKPSGIEWLGEVPEGWTVATVRRIVARVEQGWSPNCHAVPADVDQWGVVKSGCVNRGTFDERENKALPDSLEPIHEYEIRVGDVLTSRASGSPELVGSTAYVSATRSRLMLSDKIFRIRLEPNMDRRFYVALFNSRIMRYQIECAISGADGLANNLPQSALKGFFCTVPPLAEQTAIMAFLATELANFDTLTAEVQRAIDLLQERRTALISAAVTGQIDVRQRPKN